MTARLGGRRSIAGRDAGHATTSQRLLSPLDFRTGSMFDAVKNT
jgi:hypothetical protein